MCLTQCLPLFEMKGLNGISKPNYGLFSAESKEGCGVGDGELPGGRRGAPAAGEHPADGVDPPDGRRHLHSGQDDPLGVQGDVRGRAGNYED